jgi:putative membrane protein
MAQAADCIAACPVILDQVLNGLTELRSELTDANDGLLQVSGGLGMLKGSLSEAAAGLARVQCGLSNQTLKGVCDPKEPGLLEGLGALDGGVTQLVNGVVKTVQDGVGGDKDTAKNKTLRGGVHDLQGGMGLINKGGLDLLDGLGKLSDGAGELKDGTGQLSSGLGTLANGTGELDAGAGRLRDGASQLADGLGTAADGATQLADGLDEAADGAPALKDGAQQLSDEGTSKLVEAGKETAADYGKKYALITAGADRAKSEGMAYGAPTEAIGFTAYSIELAGVDGEGSRNTGRAVGALAIFGLAGGLLFWRRSLG